MKDIYSPTLNEFREIAARAPEAAGAPEAAVDAPNLIPVVREFAADLETPVSVYIKLMAQGSASFLLESVAGGEHVARYSFVGVHPRGTLAQQGDKILMPDGSEQAVRPDFDVLDALKAEMARFVPANLPKLPRFIGGAVGYLGYDVVRSFEKIGADASSGALPIPDAVYLLADTLVVFDHARHRLMILANAHVGDDVEAAYIDAIQRIEQVSERLLRPLPAIPQHRWRPGGRKGGDELRSEMEQERYEEIVQAAKQKIVDGEIFQVVLSQRLSRQTNAHPFAIYRALRMLNPSPYMFYFDVPEFEMQIIGASPEMHVRMEDGMATVRPIAGTRWRGDSVEEDDRLAAELLADPKELAEHVMLVDLGRNDLGRVSQYGSVQVEDLMLVERYSHVMHIVSQVVGKMQPGKDAFDLMRATFPAGTVSGAPKVRAMQIIEELEGTRRGLYAGAVGYFGYDGSMDTCIAIRTLLMLDDKVYIQAGAGIVADSDPTREYEECWDKAGALQEAVRRAEAGRL